MDRRQKKTRNAIFKAFIELLAKKHYNLITVGEILEKANVGRGTFYAHFETKDFLLKEFCEELFCHIFDATHGEKNHQHIFDCEQPDSIILHLIKHLQKNDNNVLKLLSCQNNQLFLQYFKDNLKHLFEEHLDLFSDKKDSQIPEDFWLNHICTTFVETINWWIANGKKQDANTLAEYFIKVV